MNEEERYEIKKKKLKGRERKIITIKNFPKKCVIRKTRRRRLRARVQQQPTRPETRLGRPALHPLPPVPSARVLSVSLAPLSLSDDWWAAAAAVSQVLRLSSVSSPATITHQVHPPLLFPSCRAKRSTETLT